MPFDAIPELPIHVLDALPNPVLVKDAETRYVWVNRAFERLFDVRSDDLVGQLDADLFQDRQAAQCNGGDLRVLASGELDEAEETVIDPELGPRQTITRKSRVIVSGVHFLVGVMHDVTDVVEANQRLTAAGEVLETQAIELRKLATTDPLTGCLNRRALFDAGKDLTAANAEPVGLIMADLDYFKSVNDCYGHDGGDAVLSEFVRLVRSVIRPDDIVARLGGEEFAILLPGADRESTENVAERVCELTRTNPVKHGGSEINVTVSVGAVHREGRAATDLEALLKLADANLYLAKDRGRDQSVLEPR